MDGARVSNVKKRVILPRIGMLAVGQETPAGRKPSKPHRVRAILRHVGDMLWRERIVVTSDLTASPYEPAACAGLCGMPKSVQRFLIKRAQCNSTFVFIGWDISLRTVPLTNFCLFC